MPAILCVSVDDIVCYGKGIVISVIGIFNVIKFGIIFKILLFRIKDTKIYGLSNHRNYVHT